MAITERKKLSGNKERNKEVETVKTLLSLHKVETLQPKVTSVIDGDSIVSGLQESVK